MGTRFEIALVREGGPATAAGDARLRAAGEAALDEIREWHERLTRFDPRSFVSHLARAAVHSPIAIDAGMCALVADALAVWRDSGGAFDVTVAPVMADRGFGASAVEPARAAVGSAAILLDARALTIACSAPLSLDFGAIGKGHALDCAAAELRRHGVKDAFLHGGTSSGVAMGRGPAGEPWRVALDDRARMTVDLTDEAFSVSDPRSQMAGDKTGHIIDPRASAGAPRRASAGRPGTPASWRRVAVTGPSARLADAWSTALAVLGEIPPAFPAGYTARWI